MFLFEKTTKTMLSALFFNSFSNLAILYFGSRTGLYFGLYSFVIVFPWFFQIFSFYSQVKTRKLKTENMYSLNTILLTSVNENEISLNIDNSTMKKSSSSNSNSNSGYTNSKSAKYG